MIDNPRILKKYQKIIDIENQKLSKKQLIETVLSNGKTVKKSSNRRLKQCAKLHKLYQKTRNIRKDFLHKTTHHIITKYDGVALETLDIQKMMENNPSSVNRAMSDVSWYEFVLLLEYKCLWKGKHFIKTAKYEPSTQRCNICKHLMSLSLDERIYKCSCGNIDDRDINASKNILEEGLRLLNEKSTAGTVGKKARRNVLKRTVKREKRMTVKKSGSLCL